MENPIENLDKILVSKIKAGDKTAFEKVYTRYSVKLFHRITGLVKSEELAEELLQDVFVKIWESRALLNPDLSFKAFLFKVAENLVHDFFRKVARDNALKDKLILLATESHNNTEENLTYKEYEALTFEAIEQLPPQRRRIFELCRFEGLSYEKVSETLNISTSTVSDHMVKSIKFIKEYLQTHSHIAWSVLVMMNQFSEQTQN